MQVTIDHNRCNLCRECLDFDCPCVLFKEEKNKIFLQIVQECIGCNFCVENCPSYAIKIGNKKNKKNGNN